MSKQIIIAEQYRIAAVFAEDQIQEIIVAQGSHQIGDIYLGIVENVLPGIDAAFVNIGDNERNGFIHVSDLGPLRVRRISGAITELLLPKQTVLVQVMKEPTGNKGPRLTGNLTLPGRYLVFMPFRRGVNLSRRILHEGERSRLRALAILIKPAGMGLLVRTEAEGVAEEAIIEDLEFLQRQWETIQQEAETTRAPALLNRDDDFIQRVLRDVYTADVNRIVTDSSAGLKRVKHHLMNWGSGKVPPGLLIDQHRDRTSILEYFRINAAVREALKPRVDLPSGGYIIIEPTEALTVIDVNSGSFTRSATARETVLWTNFEAATEIARQLRLRNLAGVIVVDFIDMDARRDQLQVLKHFEQVLKADKARPQIAQLSELGLVELTRKRQGQNIYELFGQPCKACGGLGHVVYLPGEPLPPSLESEDDPEQLYYTQLSDARLFETRSSRPEPVIDPTMESAKLGWEGAGLDDSAETPDLEPFASPYYAQRSSNRRRRRSDNGLSRGVPIELPGNPDLEEPILSTPARPDLVPTRDNFNSPSEPPLRFSSRRGGRGPSKPAETVTVEMTKVEQEVYAWMGISPLILKEQSVSDPRTVIIQVKLPDQDAPNLESESERVSFNNAANEPLTQSNSSFQAPILAKNGPDLKEVSPGFDSPEQEDLDSSLDSSDESFTEVVQPAVEEQPETRRRRRRSSAVKSESNEGESDSE